MRATWLLVIVCAGCFGPQKSFTQRMRERFAGIKLVAPPVPVIPVLPAGMPPPTTIVRVGPRAVDDPAGEPGPAPAPRSQTIYARFQGAGGKWLCEAHPNADSCSKSCNARFELALKMGGGTSCGCTSEKNCDEMVDH